MIARVMQGHDGSCFQVSRPSEKFLIEPSRKFLLTAARLKDGTDSDEPTGTGLVGLVEASPRQEGDAAGSSPEDGRERALGAQTAPAHEAGRRQGGGARTARSRLESQVAGSNTERSLGDSSRTGLAR